MMTFGVSARRSGCAIVAFDRPDVLDIERPADLEQLAARLRELAAERAAKFVIDLDQRGEALVMLLGRGPWIRYRKVAKDRAELTTTVDYALASRAFRVGREVRNAADLARALSTITKQVDEDGSPESELVTALALALLMAPQWRTGKLIW